MATRRPGSTSGRPRDASFDERALEATRELLVESGFAATTVQAIAARSGVHVSAIYRRWPSRIDLIEEAVYPGLAEPDVAPTGDLPRDIRRFVRAYVAAHDTPVARAAVPGLLAAYGDVGRPAAEQHWLPVSARPQFRDILRAAPSSSVAVGVDPDDVFDVLLGAIVARVLIPTVAQRGRPVERLVELVLCMLQTTAPTAVR